MKILVLNCGSSSIKYQLWDMAAKICKAIGVAEKVGLKGSFVKLEKENGEKVKFDGEIIDHLTGIEYILGILTSEEHGCLKELEEIDAVGHRVAHGGEHFKESAYIDDFVLGQIKKCTELAPLHNPANLKGIEAMSNLLPGIKQVATFDTAFHQTMPPKAFMYAIPYSLYEKYGIRRYGFHGTSHSYIAKKACEELGVDIKTQKIITCHIGNGASMCAIKDGVSVDTTMGFTPVEGLMMGTRSGDLDLGVVSYIMDKEELGISSLNTLFNKSSGMLGVSGISSDMREVWGATNEGHERAEIALEMYTYRISKYIGAYSAAMRGVDLVIFSGGIGENAHYIRSKSCEGFEFLGLEFDSEKNASIIGQQAIISKESSKVTCMVVPTNEEYVIATDTEQIINSLN